MVVVILFVVRIFLHSRNFYNEEKRFRREDTNFQHSFKYETTQFFLIFFNLTPEVTEGRKKIFLKPYSIRLLMSFQHQTCRKGRDVGRS